jgi:hypothetical protein
MSDGMPVERGPAEMFTLHNRETVRLQLPDLPLEGAAEPLRIFLDFDAESVDEVLERLTVLRTQMLPAPQRN